MKEKNKEKEVTISIQYNDDLWSRKITLDGDLEANRKKIKEICLRITRTIEKRVIEEIPYLPLHGK